MASALRVIMTWAKYDHDHKSSIQQTRKTLDPTDVMELCSRALREAGKLGGEQK